MGVPTAKDLFFSRTPLDAEAWAARERAFFHAIRLKNGTYKTTYSHRLDTVNEIVNRLLASRRPVEIMDVAVSSGVGTLEWMESLDRAGIQYRMTAGDLCVKAFLLSFGQFLNVLVDKSGYPLQFDILGRAIPYPIGRRRTALLPPLFILVETFRWMSPILLAALFKPGGIAAEAESVRRFGVSCRRILLTSPRLRERTSLNVLEDDLLAPGLFADRFHVLRAANVLNKHYFSDATLTTMVANMHGRLKQDGILVVCRTADDNVNHGTVFRLNEAGRFEVVCRIGDGSEIEDLVLDVSGSAVSTHGRSRVPSLADVGAPRGTR
jgi:hypothetical protein